MKCKYCEYKCDTNKQMLKHLNECHVSCAECGTVFDTDEFDDHWALCGKCCPNREEEI